MNTNAPLTLGTELGAPRRRPRRTSPARPAPLARQVQAPPSGLWALLALLLLVLGFAGYVRMVNRRDWEDGGR